MSKIIIGEHIKIIPGYPFNSSEFNNEGEGLPLIRIRDLLTSKIETFYKGEYQNDFLIEKGDILIGMDGDFHIVRWKNNAKALLNQRIMKVAQKEGAEINIDYFYYYLFPYLDDVWEKTTATTVKHLSTFDISLAEVEFPDFGVQRKIAQILSTADAVIEKTQAAIAKYKAIKQGMLHDLFTRGIDLETNKLRPKQEDAPELYKESKLGWIPKEWEVLETNQIGEVISGATPSTSVQNFWDGKIVWITPSDLSKQKESIYFQKTTRKISELGLQNCSASLIPENNLVISSRAPIGYLSIVKFPFTTNQGCKSIRFFKKQVPEFFYYNFLLNVERLKIFGEGTTFAEISKADLDIFPLVVCDEVEQNIISKRLLIIDNKIQTEQNYLHKQQQIKSGLMADLLSGKKEVIVEEKTHI